MKLRCPGTWMTIPSMSRSLLTAAAVAGLLVLSPLQPAAYAATVAPGAAVANAPYRLAQNDGISLEQAISKVRRQYGDVTILKAETKRKNGRRVHRVKFLTEGGRVRTVKVDANTGEFR